MKNKIYIEFASRQGDAYEIVDGITMGDEYSETLDSVSIVLDNIAQNKRIQSGYGAIEPYSYARVYGTGDFSFSKVMLVDTFIETEKNVISHIYSYQITLMSELKMLEKAQCPNLAITHSISGTKNSIYYYIYRYMNQYCPRAKIRNNLGSYSVSPIFSISEDVRTRFDAIECADFSMNCPTLRQVITNLMLQDGCIPTIDKGVLKYLDLKKANPTEFTPDETITRITKSMSSDSFVNSLSYIGEQVLDSGNEVISERVGFRDRDNVLLKQTSNLFLNTSFPIYKVNSLKMILNGTRVLFKSRRITGSWNAYVSNVQWSSNGIYDRWTINILGGTSDSTLKNFKIHLVKGVVNAPTSTTILQEFKRYYVDDWALSEEDTKGESDISSGRTRTITIDDTTYQSGGSGAPGYSVWIEFDSTNEAYGSEKCVIAPSLATTYGGALEVYLNNISSSARGTFKFDITPLCVENAKRSQLDVDFSEMEEVETIEELAEYYYGTIGYSIGSKKISGFSQTYSKTQGWWTKTKTYIENIVDVVKSAIESGNQDAVSEINPILVDYYPNELISLPSEYIDIPSYSSLTFELKYQPLNEFNMTFLKDSDNPIRISQYDSGNGGVQDFDRLYSNMADKINRLGNDVLVIMQTTDDASKIIDITSNGVVSYDGYQIFKRMLSIRNNRISATYYASKGYVMQNYFTAITTKYRAYENVDYESSTKRRENVSRYLLITEDTHTFVSDSDVSVLNGYLSMFMSGATSQNHDNKIRYAINLSGNSAYINEVSAITAKNAFAFSYNQFDNVMAGLKLKTYKADDDLGGIEQKWLPLSDSFQTKNQTYFASYIPFNNRLDQAVGDAMNVPEVTLYKYDIDYLFGINRYLYKDKGETLSLTFQLELYTDSDNIEWTDAFMENCQFISNNDFYPNMVTINRTDELSDTEREVNLVTSLTYVDPSDAITFGSNTMTIHWDLLGDYAQTMRISHWEPVEHSESVYDRKVIDYIEIKRNPSNAETQTFNLYLNDCKSCKAMTRDENGLLYIRYTI